MSNKKSKIPLEEDHPRVPAKGTKGFLDYMTPDKFNNFLSILIYRLLLSVY